MAVTIDDGVGVRIHEATRITPYYSNSTDEFSLPLTLFDTYWLMFLPVERLFFYPITDLTSDFFNSVILPKLKHSLSLTLDHYLPLVCSLMWPEDTAKPPAICYFANDGVSVTVAESSADFNTVSGDGIREAVGLRPLTPQLSISDDKAEVLAIQITLFPKQGFCIGIATHHAIFDGRSSERFIKSWAYLCKQDEENPSLSPELTPSFDRTVIKDTNGIHMVYVNGWLNFTSSNSDHNKRSLKLMPSMLAVNKLVRATFVLKRDDIKKLRAKVLSVSENKQSDQLHLSTFVLTCAYTHTCLVKAKGVESYEDVCFTFTADYRNRLHPPVPMNYFGNCVGTHTRIAKARDFIKETGVSFVAEQLSDMVKELENGISLEGFEEKFVKLMSIIKAAEGAQRVGVAGSIGFDIYGSDFGWVRPKKVEIVSIDTTGVIALAKCRDENGGVQIGVVLGPQQMENFASLFEQGLKDIVLEG